MESILLFLIVMLCFGFVISSFVPVFFNLPSRPFNFSFRLLYLVLTGYLILHALQRIHSLKLSYVFWAICLFVVLYSVRILVDIFIYDIVFKESVFYTITSSLLGSFLPFIAIGLNSDRINYSALIKYSYVTLVISVILIIVLIYKLYGGFNLEFFATRFSFISEDGKQETINPITLSFYGTSITLISLALLILKQKYNRIILLASIVGGLVLTVLGASRGPFVTLFVGVFYILYVFFFRKTKSVLVKFWSFLAFVFVFLALYYAFISVNLEEINLYNRFVSIGSDSEVNSASIREIYWARAWQLFLDSPIFGYSYLDPITLGYPHNVYLESLMSMGVFGFLFFVIPIIILLSKRSLNDNQVFVYLLFLMIVSSSFFSGGLFINPFLWCIVGIMLGFRKIRGNALKVKVSQL